MSFLCLYIANLIQRSLSKNKQGEICDIPIYQTPYMSERPSRIQFPHWSISFITCARRDNYFPDVNNASPTLTKCTTNSSSAGFHVVVVLSCMEYFSFGDIGCGFQISRRTRCLSLLDITVFTSTGLKTWWIQGESGFEISWDLGWENSSFITRTLCVILLVISHKK